MDVTAIQTDFAQMLAIHMKVLEIMYIKTTAALSNNITGTPVVGNWETVELWDQPDYWLLENKLWFWEALAVWTGIHGSMVGIIGWLGYSFYENWRKLP